MIPLRLDIYRPAGTTGPVPAVIVIHGSGWQSDTYDNANGTVTPLLQRGVAVVAVEYRLSGEAIFPAQIHNVKAAVRFIRAVAGDINFDGKVNVFDLQILAASWNRSLEEQGFNARADSDVDDRVNVFDLREMAANWGRSQ